MFQPASAGTPQGSGWQQVALSCQPCQSRFSLGAAASHNPAQHSCWHERTLIPELHHISMSWCHAEKRHVVVHHQMQYLESFGEAGKLAFYNGYTFFCTHDGSISARAGCSAHYSLSFWLERTVIVAARSAAASCTCMWLPHVLLLVTLQSLNNHLL